MNNETPRFDEPTSQSTFSSNVDCAQLIWPVRLNPMACNHNWLRWRKIWGEAEVKQLSHLNSARSNCITLGGTPWPQWHHTCPWNLVNLPAVMTKWIDSPSVQNVLAVKHALKHCCYRHLCILPYLEGIREIGGKIGCHCQTDGWMDGRAANERTFTLKAMPSSAMSGPMAKAIANAEWDLNGECT